MTEENNKPQDEEQGAAESSEQKEEKQELQEEDAALNKTTSEHEHEKPAQHEPHKLEEEHKKQSHEEHPKHEQEHKKQSHEEHPKHEQEHKKNQKPREPLLKKIKHIYEHEYRKLLIIPLIIILLSIAQIGYQVATTGDFISKGVSLKGGVTVLLQGVDRDIVSLEEYLVTELPEGDINVRLSGENAIIVDASDVDTETLIASLDKKLGGLDPDMYSVTNVGASLGSSFFKEMIGALLVAFLFMGVVVFITFRIPAPSIAVVAAAASDMIVTLAIVNLIGMKLSTAGIASFLMLIGYSVDTDILLSTRVLKRKTGTVMDRIYGAMKTGLTMSCTTIVAITVALTLTSSDTIREIMIILLIGLLVDIIMTWIQNVGILRLYLDKKNESRD